MTWASLAWLWFALALGCILLGLAMTGKRVAAIPPAKRARRRQAHAPGADRRNQPVCSRCAQPLESDARFCGACGLYLSHTLEQHKAVRRI